MDNSECVLETESERIEKQIEDTKMSLAEKVEELQSELSSTFQGAETSVRDTMTEVRRSLSLSHQMQKNPVVLVLGSVVVGVLAGRMLCSSGTKKKKDETPTNGEPSAPSAFEQQKSAGVGITDSFMDEIVHLKTIAIGALFGALREVAQRSAPVYTERS
jgi:hypothetical protein